MRFSSWARAVCALPIAALALVPAVALAHGDSGATQLPKNAPAVTKDGEVAKSLLTKLEADSITYAIVKEIADKAELALARAHGAKLSGDDDGARMLSDVGLGLAKQADATVRAAAEEKKASDAEKAASDIGDDVKRAKTLLAETEARRATISAELERAKADAAATSADAAKKEQDRLDKKKPPAKREGAPKH